MSLISPILASSRSVAITRLRFLKRLQSWGKEGLCPTQAQPVSMAARGRSPEGPIFSSDIFKNLPYCIDGWILGPQVLLNRTHPLLFCIKKLHGIYNCVSLMVNFLCKLDWAKMPRCLVKHHFCMRL